MSARPLRVVLVGYGPVGARLVEELLPAVGTGDIELTVVGAEKEDAYNRVLVAEYAVGAAASLISGWMSSACLSRWTMPRWPTCRTQSGLSVRHGSSAACWQRPSAPAAIALVSFVTVTWFSSHPSVPIAR